LACGVVGDLPELPDDEIPWTVPRGENPLICPVCGERRVPCDPPPGVDTG